MRPINLIPPEQRRGEQAPLRSGPLAYMVLAGLVLVLVGVTALVLTNNEIGEGESDVARLQAEDAVAADQAERLVAYTQFQTLSEQRVATVASLADSRFDWERVMRELALILPGDVWLVELEASAAAGSSGGSAAVPGIAGPSLVLTGCADGQEGVAGFVTALKDIDGVTRVGVESSELPEQQAGGGSGGGGSDDGDECRTRDFIARFEIVAAFDAAPVPPSTSAGGAAPVATTTESEDGSDQESTDESGGSEDEGGSEEASEDG